MSVVLKGVIANEVWRSLFCFKAKI